MITEGRMATIARQRAETGCWLGASWCGSTVLTLRVVQGYATVFIVFQPQEVPVLVFCVIFPLLQF